MHTYLVAFSFRWIDWNISKCKSHGIHPCEAEEVVNSAARPYPRCIEDQKMIVRGQTIAGRYVQVIYLIEMDGNIFVIHSRPLTDKEKRQLRRNKR